MTLFIDMATTIQRVQQQFVGRETQQQIANRQRRTQQHQQQQHLTRPSPTRMSKITGKRSLRQIASTNEYQPAEKVARTNRTRTAGNPMGQQTLLPTTIILPPPAASVQVASSLPPTFLQAQAQAPPASNLPTLSLSPSEEQARAQAHAQQQARAQAQAQAMARVPPSAASVQVACSLPPTFLQAQAQAQTQLQALAQETQRQQQAYHQQAFEQQQQQQAHQHINNINNIPPPIQQQTTQPPLPQPAKTYVRVRPMPNIAPPPPPPPPRKSTINSLPSLQRPHDDAFVEQERKLFGQTLPSLISHQSMNEAEKKLFAELVDHYKKWPVIAARYARTMKQMKTRLENPARTITSHDIGNALEQYYSISTKLGTEQTQYLNEKNKLEQKLRNKMMKRAGRGKDEYDEDDEESDNKEKQNQCME